MGERLSAHGNPLSWLLLANFGNSRPRIEVIDGRARHPEACIRTYSFDRTSKCDASAKTRGNPRASQAIMDLAARLEGDSPLVINQESRRAVGDWQTASGRANSQLLLLFIIIVIVVMMMVMMPFAMTIIAILVDHNRRPVVPWWTVVSRYVDRGWCVVPWRGDVLRRRRYDNHSRQSDADIDRPVGRFGVRRERHRRYA